MQVYQETYAAWQAERVGFWINAAKNIDWTTKPKRGFEPNQGVYGRWFPDARGNTCYNCLDRHVAAGRADQAALIYDSPVTNTKTSYSYGDLLREVNALAFVLRYMNVGLGDRVIIYMPMIPQAAIAMLACARIGAVHSIYGCYDMPAATISCCHH